MKRILVLHGPNLNRLGMRECTLYGTISFSSMVAALDQKAKSLGVALVQFQSNSESSLIEQLQTSEGAYSFLVLNPAGLTHTSVCLRDAVLAASIPFLEIHLTNVYTREPFRHLSYFSDIALGVICGLGVQGYLYALEYAADYLNSANRGTTTERVNHGSSAIKTIN